MTEPRTVCAWCGLVLREGPEPTSHGICDTHNVPAGTVSCRERFEAEAEDFARDNRPLAPAAQRVLYDNLDDLYL